MAVATITALTESKYKKVVKNVNSHFSSKGDGEFEN